MKDNKPNLEDAFKQLDQLLKEMESPEISLEDSFSKYTKGIELIKICNNSIDKIEQELIILEEQEIE